MKRFTETEKWSDPWFRKLKGTVKLGYLYLLDRVDNSGVIDLDTELANFQIGMEIDWESVRSELGDRILILPCGKWHLTRFIGFQFGELKEDCKPHAQVIRLMDSHGIDRDSKGYTKGIDTPQDKDKDIDKDKKTETELRVGALMKRRPSTPMSPSEARAYKGALPAIKAMTEEDWQILEAFYQAPQQKTFARKDMGALLNNWNGEVDKAKEWAKTHKPAGTPVRSIPSLPEPPNWQAIIDREFPNCAHATGREYGGRKWAAMSPGDQAAIAGTVKPFLPNP